MAQLDTALQFVRFGFAGKALIPARGLFALYCSATEGNAFPADPAKIELGFIDGYGVMHEASTVTNPWFLYSTTRRPTLADTKQAAPPLKFAAYPYLFCLIAHPSPEYAKDLLRRARDGQPMTDSGDDFVWTLLTPEAVKGTLQVVLPETSSAYVPRGPKEFDGWMLYYRMPYAHVVNAHVFTLTGKLAALKYPVPTPNSTLPYEASGTFTSGVQAALHRFQADAQDGKAFAFDRARTTGDHAAWGYLRGRHVSTDPAPIPERGMVDAATVAAFDHWQSNGLINPGDVLVNRGSLWARPELWWRFWALELVCDALGAAYGFYLSNSFRYVGAAGAGQAAQSKHKLGVAVDIDSVLGAPNNNFPLAYEADWQPHGKQAYKARWLLYIHSTVSVEASPDLTKLKQVPDALRQRINETWGDGEPSPMAEQVHADVVALVQELVHLSLLPGQVTKTRLTDEYFRHSIRRFQFRENEPDGGDPMPLVTAADDAANQVKLAGRSDIRSWLNFTRIAHDLKLFRISARDDFRTVHYDKKRSLAIKIASSSIRASKALAMDRIADSIGNDPDLFVPIREKDTEILRAPAHDFNLDALRHWLTRPSDDPEERPEALEGFDYPKHGIDLIMDVMWTPDAKERQLRFLKSRGEIPVMILEMGDGFADLELHSGREYPARKVATLLEAAKPLPAASEYPYRLVLRPLILKTRGLIDEHDPGELTYVVPERAVVKSLEWWHFELDWNAENWQQQAHALGYHSEALANSAIAKADTTSPPGAALWQGGGGFVKPSSNYKPPARPDNYPQNPELPES